MQKKLTTIILVVVLILSLFSACGQKDEAVVADTVVTGKIYTMTAEGEAVEAVAIKDGTYIYTGDEQGVQSYIGENTEVIALEEGVAMPSFGDGHAHGSLAGYEALYEVSLYECTSVDEMLETVAAFIKEHPDMTYITGTGWMNGYFPPEGPTAAMLDEINSEIPIAIISGDHHSLWANSKAMEMAGVNAETADVAGGVIVRDAKGNPTGCFREKAQGLVADTIPGYSVDQAKAAILAYQQDMVAAGITCYYDPFVANEKGPNKENGNLLTAYKELGQDGEMLIRTYGGYGIKADTDPLAEIEKVVKLKKETASDWFNLTSVKIVLDGVVEGRTAYLHEDYADEPGYRGEALWPQDLLNQVCAAADAAGLQIHIHTIGDAAVTMAMDALEYVKETNGTSENRHILTHLQLVNPEDAVRMGELGVIASVNFDWHFKEDAYFHELEVPYLGEERANSEYPAKMFFDAGCVVAAASDYPVGLPASPLMEMEIGVTRSNPWEADPSTLLNPDQKVSLYQMMEAVSKNQAYQHFGEDTFGIVEVGKSADLVVLGNDIMEVDPTQIYETPILRTMLKGKTLYTAE